jgi:hypothetical protein
MKLKISLSFPIILLLSSCGNAQPAITPTNAVAQTPFTLETPETIATFTPLPAGCATPSPDEINDFIGQSITDKDNGKTLVTHVTSRFWIYLDDRTYSLPDLMQSLPNGLLGYISNGSIRGPQCYPIMFEAVKEGKGLLQIKNFKLWIVVNDALPESKIPLP